jgi:hypothetical protein
MKDLYQSFVDKWTHPNHRAQPCTPASLDLAESQLGAALPAALREFLESFGPVSTSIDLLDTIVEGELDLYDVSDFHDPDAIVQETLGWRKLGLPADLVAFARDCQGNLFCFTADNERQPDSEVWYFDHDLGNSDSLGVDFKSWVGAFAGLRA